MTIRAETIACLEGSAGLITLDSPRSLNALSEDMIITMQATLDAWAEDPEICLVILQGAGDRAFCAGGNIRELYNVLGTDQAEAEATRYFSTEYRLDYTLHTYRKPLICWAHGVVMGGGLGLLAASRYRLVTPSAQLAMPEISIGLFPDVGAGYFLNRLPEGMGLFLGLTGARLNQNDSLRIGLADMTVPEDGFEALVEHIRESRWRGEVAADDNRLYRLLNQFSNEHQTQPLNSELAEHEQTIATLCRGESLPDIVRDLLARETDSGWWQTAANNLRSGCPTSAWLVFEQLRHARQLSLKEIFRSELAMAVNCCNGKDLKEGIRARLIDKDQQPQWQHSSVEVLTADDVARYFIAPWAAAEDPLADLD